MPSSILILDDDSDFNSLLTDIFEQAGYIVTSMEEPLEAVEVFTKTDYDLIVTDHKMPDMSGIEFIKKIKQIKPKVPVIMISGYLENDTIRDLISEGVGGVFLKPLNIFSLLERSTELINESKKPINSTYCGQEQAEESDSPSPPTAYSFHSFPRRSKASIAFAERLYSLRNFKSTLTLIGEPGTRFRAICEDLSRFYDASKEVFAYLNKVSFDAKQIKALVAAAKKQRAERMTCVLLNFESMSEEQKLLAVNLCKGDGEFDNVSLDLRTIFTVNADLDSLFDADKIDENLYILMGTAEVRVPPLRECAQDIPILAQQFLLDIAHEKNLRTAPQIERAAFDFFKTHEWSRNHIELRELMEAVIAENSGKNIGTDLLQTCLERLKPKRASQQLHDYLHDLQMDYLLAAQILLNNDPTRVSEFFATSPQSIERAGASEAN